MKNFVIKPQLNYKSGILCFVLIMLLNFSAITACAQDIQTERVTFSHGETSATVENSISGRETIDYILNVKEGQYINISMASENNGIYFNIMEPDQEYEAFHIGSVKGNQYEGTVSENGDYRIRVYLMKGARNTSANFRLEMIVTGG